MPSAALPLTGRCQCSAIRYEVPAAPLEVYVCHCTECRRQSASAFGISVFVPSDSIRVLSGTPRRWSRPGATAGVVDCFFCGERGVRLWHVRRGAEGVGSIKGGSSDLGVDIGAAVHVWTKHKLPGVIIPAHARQFAQEPDH